MAQATKEFLKKHPKVKGFEDAHPSSGGFGAKVVKTLKLREFVISLNFI